MFKPTVKNILFYWLIKYVLFYFLLMFKNNDFTLIRIDKLENGEDLFYYLWLFLFIPVICILILSVPLYHSFRAKNKINQYFVLITLLVVEYLLYTYLASPSDLWNGVYNAFIGVVVMALLFSKYIFNANLE